MTEQKRCSCCNRSLPRGCCAGIEAVTPLSVVNRPGLDELTYRVGTHATFLETMKARLSNLHLHAESGEASEKGKGSYPLRQLTTRATHDPSIALLDAWATIADVLTFYQERIANEGYLRTATERHSILELARLVGYQLRPGVAATTYLALTLEDKHNVVIEPSQLRAQSIPGPGELPQAFENSDTLDARARWNKLQPRMTQPQRIETLQAQLDLHDNAKLYLKGIATGLSKNDPLLIAIDDEPDLYRVIEVTPDAIANHTLVAIQRWEVQPATHDLLERIQKITSLFREFTQAKAILDALLAEAESEPSKTKLADFIERESLPALASVAVARDISVQAKERLHALSNLLREGVRILRSQLPAELDELNKVVPVWTKRASVPPANALRLGRTAAQAFTQRSDLGMQVFGVLRPMQRETLTPALASATVTPPITFAVYALRVKAAPFGHNAPLRTEITEAQPGITPSQRQVNFLEWTADDVAGTRKAEEIFKDRGRTFSNVLHLDANYDKILADSWVVVDTSAVTPTDRIAPTHPPLLFVTAGQVQTNVSRAAYGMSGKSTRVELVAARKSKRAAAWFTFTDQGQVENSADFQIIRRTAVYAQSEQLELAEAPIGEPICNPTDDASIQLDGVYSELKSGRWVVVAGERDDIKDSASKTVEGVKASELVMLADVVHDFDPTLPGDTIHTRIKFARKLEYCYRRDRVTIYANVVKATHGETRREVLGSGDGSKALQRFALRQPPVTYVSSPTPAGAESTLKLFVNNVQWHETDTLFGLAASARRFVTQTSDDAITTAIFGNGEQGARLPTGAENVRAEYRQGIGKAGNVRAEQISLLVSRPLGVKEVINPLRAAGGADKENRDQARKNAPLAVLALDRLVSTQDYSDFARTFAGVGKAFATRLSDGRRELVHVTIAGADDIPIDETSDLYRNLKRALQRFGEPGVPVTLAVRELVLLIVSANVRLLPNYLWEAVAPQIRRRLLDTLSFEQSELGQDVTRSDVISTVQRVPGVAYVDIDHFGGVAEKDDGGSVRTPKQLLDAAQAVIDSNEQNQRVSVNLPQLTGAGIHPAQLAYLAPDVQDTLILNLI